MDKCVHAVTRIFSSKIWRMAIAVVIQLKCRKVCFKCHEGSLRDVPSVSTCMVSDVCWHGYFQAKSVKKEKNIYVYVFLFFFL